MHVNSFPLSLCSERIRMYRPLYVCVCACVCVCVCVHVHIRSHVHKFIHIYAGIHTYLCVITCVYVRERARIMQTNPLHYYVKAMYAYMLGRETIE
jgi:hypothetical protein